MSGFDNQQISALSQLLSDPNFLRSALQAKEIANTQGASTQETPGSRRDTKRGPNSLAFNSTSQQNPQNVLPQKRPATTTKKPKIAAKPKRKDLGPRQRSKFYNLDQTQDRDSSRESSPEYATLSNKTQSQARPSLRHHAYIPGTYRDDVDLYDLEQTEDETADKTQDAARFVVGLDFGTTFTSVSYYAHSVKERFPIPFPTDIRSIKRWPNDQVDGYRNQIPTESLYPLVKRVRKWVRDKDDARSSDSNQSESEDTQVSDTSVAGTSTISGNQDRQYFWGWDCFYERYLQNTGRDPVLHVERSKSMLVRSPFTQEDRVKLRPQLDHMIKAGLIRKLGKKGVEDPRDVQDVVSDFLTEVLKHTQEQLSKDASFTTECPVSFAITVPVVWSQNSSRIFQDAMEEAIRNSGFGSLGYGSIDNLFITTEPEAAATYLVASSSSVFPGEAFIVLDCGGGTVDCVTYTVTNSDPLRLDMEAAKPSGDNCGGSYLNDRYARRILDRLRDEDYLDWNGETRKSIVKRLVPAFETVHKRIQDITKRPSHKIRIRGLLQSTAKRFEANHMFFEQEDYDFVFLPILERVAIVLRKQLDQALTSRKQPTKVFLIGGFGAAPSLRSYMADYLRNFAAQTGLKGIKLIPPPENHDSATIVASGAVLRALNKDNGPKRMAESSYGFLRIEPYQPDIVDGHKQAEPFVDEMDGLEYVAVIDYFMLKKTIVKPRHTYKPFRSYHAFEIDCEKSLCEEVLYVSDDDASESHFPLNHFRNRKAEVVGKIITDMSFLRDDKLIKPILPGTDDEGEFIGKKHFRVEYDIVPIVEGRNLRYEARYPPGSSSVRKTGQISIAAAFKPGTI